MTVSKVEELDVDYDEEADVLYISFGPPKAASDSTILNNDIILHYKGDRIMTLSLRSRRSLGLLWKFQTIPPLSKRILLELSR